MAKIKNINIPVHSYNTIVVGSGAASLNAAIHLYNNGVKDIAIVTDGLGDGTSANTGSDKQTFYKLSVSGDYADSPVEMAKSLYDGGSMDGDIALVEATVSAQEFFHLVELGVKFPHNEYGAYVGYKTDHDPKARATSTGPLTSQNMFACLIKDIKSKKIEIFDKVEAVKLLTIGRGENKRTVGMIGIDKKTVAGKNFGMILFNSQNLVFGVGGPAGIYKNSVYPESQIGSIGLAFEIGAIGRNLTESQYGLASTKFRWNVSGTYQQVIPRYISTDKNGKDEQDFLNKYFPSMGKMATAIFLKGYQWPFDPRKIENLGSSIVDILVYRETSILGRRVFMDFRNNPKAGSGLAEFKFEDLEKEAYEYLKKSDALLSTPIERLKKMNQPAIDLYKSHGIDITKEPLEIAVCAQHNNGGLKGNMWWESNIRHLFPVGEVNGSHGVYRPGGSALNSGQAGSYRAAQYISKRYAEKPASEKHFLSAVKKQVEEKIAQCERIVEKVRKVGKATEGSPELVLSAVEGRSRGMKEEDKIEIMKIREEIQERMSKFGSHVRDLSKVKEALKKAYELRDKIVNQNISNRKCLLFALKNTELCLTHIFYLEAVKAYLETGAGSRGSYMVMDKNGILPCDKLSEEFKFKKYDSSLNEKIGEVQLDETGKIKTQFVERKPFPKKEFWFENVWNAYRRDEIVR